MRKLVQFELENHTLIAVEVDEPWSEGGLQRASASGEVVERAEQSFEKALEGIKPAAAAVVTKLRQLSDSPDEIAAEFGIKLSAKAGAVLAAAGVEANYKVTLTWKRKVVSS